MPSVQRLLLTLRDVMHMTSLPKSTIYEMVEEGSFPRPVLVRQTKRTKRWRRVDVEYFIASLPLERKGPDEPPTARRKSHQEGG